MKKLPSKQHMIERHLMRGRKITQRDAIRKFSHYRLAVVINRLRDLGWRIKTVMKTEGDSTFAEYQMTWP